MEIFKKKTIFISTFLALILCLSFLLPTFINSKNNVSTRDINVSEIGTLSYEEKVDNLQKKFCNVVTKTEDNLSYFSGDININKLDLLSTSYEDSDVTKNYQSIINNQDESIKITSSIVVDGEVVDCQSLNFTTEFSEESEQLFIIDENGNKTDILDQLNEDKIEECFALVLILSALTIKQIVAIVAISAISIIVIANADQIAEDITSLTTGIRDGVISFWDRIKLACGKITAIVLGGTILITQAIALELYEIAKNRKDQYLLCGTVTGSGFIPVYYKFTNYENARNWIKKGGSIWSPFSSTASKAVEGAGYIPGVIQQNISETYVAERHKVDITINNIEYSFAFYHYHALKKSNFKKLFGVHSFFGLPFSGEPVGR